MKQILKALEYFSLQQDQTGGLFCEVMDHFQQQACLPVKRMSE
ncbi:hypothetical protein [Methylomonas sp.]|nr:hypothetical protein [Methylomonas sp.]